ncbi:MAG: DNA polymerase IV [Candidatus Aenigmarchaeota archaeon]|nr:DNA polymerase IV [Candidatus Aenigmarchaeota archaeon]
MPRIIMHVDMDAFFASIEQNENPEYRGKPVIVGADPKNGKGRGVVSTPSYEARKFGVRSGMPISGAWKLCPQAIYLPVNFKLYEEVSSRIMKILRRYAEKFEQVSIDEAFLDISNKVKNFEEAKKLAEEIKNEIREKESLTCSIGIAPNKLIAKIASGYKKPDGLTVVKEDEVKKFLSPLPVRELWGIGRKTEQRLRKMGIKTIGDLAKANPLRIVENFGSLGAEFIRMANGIDESEVIEEWVVKSVGRETTFEEDTLDPAIISDAIEELSKEVHEEILSNKFLFKTITIKIRYEDFETHTHSKTLPFATNRIEDLIENAYELTSPFLQSEKKIRLVGVRVSNFISAEKQKTLAKL